MRGEQTPLSAVGTQECFTGASAGTPAGRLLLAHPPMLLCSFLLDSNHSPSLQWDPRPCWSHRPSRTPRLLTKLRKMLEPHISVPSQLGPRNPDKLLSLALSYSQPELLTILQVRIVHLSHQNFHTNSSTRIPLGSHLLAQSYP